MKDHSLPRRRKPKIKLICSFNGTFQPRPPSGKLRYTGGETRIISVDRNIGFSRFRLKISELVCYPNKCQHFFSLLYQLPDSEPTQEQAPLVSIASDDDVRCMIDEYEKLEFYGKHCRLWIFVCNDNGYVNLRKKDDGISNFVETESLSSGLGVLCNNSGFDGDKHKTRLMSETLSLCENGFANQKSLTNLCGGQFGGDKAKKRVTSGDKVKSSEDSLRKMVLKQQLLAKQSARTRSFSGGIGLALEHAEKDRANFDNEKHGHALIDLSPESETPLSFKSKNLSFVASSYRGNTLDYKFYNPNFVESKNFSNFVPSSEYCSHPLNPKNGNPRVELNNSRHDRQSNLSFGNAHQSSTCNFSQSIGVLPFPKPNSMGNCYVAKCEPRSVEPSSSSNMNRENIMPWGADSMTLRMGLTPFSCGNQLVGNVYSASSSYSSSHSGIHNHQFGLSNARNQRIFPNDFRNNRSNLNKIRNHRNAKLDGRPWVGNFYPGLRSSSSISKQGQLLRSYYPTLLKPLSDSHHQQVEGELRTSEYVLNKETSSLSHPYGNQENISEQGGLGVPNDGNPNLNECHSSFYDPVPGNQSLLPLSASENSSGCIKKENTQIDLLTDPGTVQHEVTIQRDANITNSPNKLGLECHAKLSEIGAGFKSFSKHQTGAHTLEGSIASSVNFTLHNLCLSSSFKDVEPPTPPGISNISEALLKPQSNTFDLMDEDHFSSGPQVQSSSGAAYTSSEKTLKLQKDTDQEAELQQDLESTLIIDEKEVIKKTHTGSKINGGIPTELATVYTHLVTRDLQTIKNSDLEYIKELGLGTYGTVFYGKWKGSDVAVKRLKPGCFNGGAVEEDRLVADFWKEAHILGQLHHPNIVALYGVVTDGPVTNLATVTEYMVNRSLKQVLRRKDRTIDRRKRLILAMDAAFGMEYLHEKNIVHFDLKSHNFLVNMRDPQRPVCKIGDLGLSKIKQKTLVSGGVRGTIPWMAPELLNSENMVTEKVDVYSFGIVMWELLTGEEPYENMRSHEIIAGIIKGTLRPEIPNWCDPAWRSLMEKCWSSDPDARPSFTEIAKELRAMAAAMNIK